MGTERYRLTGLNAAGPVSAPRPASGETQSRRLLFALALLLIVLGVVVMRNSDFWFGPSQTAEADAAPSDAAAYSVIPSAKESQSAATQVAKPLPVAKASPDPADGRTPQIGENDSIQPVVARNRVVLPALDVEVVAGNEHSTIHPGSNAMTADISGDAARTVTVASAANLSTSAAERERLSTVAAPELQQTLNAMYPALGQHSRVQGSVVLEAVIAADGSIEGLRVVSGPSILTDAAQQAVREWRFKPYLINGQPVETKCTVTVNFSIRVSDTSSQIS